MKNLGTAVFGLGNIGVKYDLNNNFYKTHIKTLKKNKFFEILFSVDRDQKQNNLVKKYYDIETYKYIKDCPNIKLSLAVVSLPTNIHYKACKEILEKFSPKVLLLEKPGCNDLNELKKINNLCRKKKCYLAINYIRRFDLNISKIKKKFFSKKNIFKNFKYAKVYFNGSIQNTCSHYINLLHFFINDFNHEKIKVIKLNENFIIKKKFYKQKEENFFFFFKKKNLKSDEIDFVFTNYTIKYNNKDGNFFITDHKKSKMIKTDLKNYQNSVYNSIMNYFKKKVIKTNSNYKDAAVTHKILRKL
jgi:predicted dehydrogenase